MVFELSDGEIRKRLVKYGENKFFEVKRPDLFDSFLSQFHLQMVALLIVAIIISQHNFTFSVVAVAFVIFMAAVETARDFRIKNAIFAIQSAYVGETTVLRSGVRKKISVSQVVPGDVVILHSGDRIPADGVVIEQKNCMVDEKIFGRGVVEKKSVKEAAELKTFEAVADPSILFAGSYVVEGECVMKISATGTQTEFAKTVKALPSEKEIISKVSRVTSSLSSITFIIVIVIFLAQLLQFSILDALAIAVAAAVAGIPQYSLATAQTVYFLTLERISKTISVRKERIADNLKEVSVVCTEKLALTMGQSTVRRIWMDGKDCRISGNGWSTKGALSGEVNYLQLSFLTKLCAITTEAYLEKEDEKVYGVGDSVGCALVVLAEKNFQPVQSLRSQNPILHLHYDEDSQMKITKNLFEGKKVICARGPAQNAILQCDRVVVEGKVEKIKEKQRRDVEYKIVEMAADGFDVIAICYKEKEGEKFVLLALLGIYDPPKEGMRGAIEELKEIGIRTVVLTEESESIAVGLARELGLLEKGKRAFICSELEAIPTREKIREVKQGVVFARAMPEDKLMIIQELQRAGENVLFVEGGTLDAQAILASNTSIALESATDVSKFNADGILLRDDFSFIPKIIENAREMKEKVEGTFYLIFSLDFSILFFVLLSSIFLTKSNPLQILLLNTFADSLAGVLALQRLPRTTVLKKRKRAFPSREEFVFSLLIALFASVFAFSIFTYGFSAVLPFLFIFIAATLNSTSIDDSIFSVKPSKQLLGACAFALLLTAIFSFLPSTQLLFGTVFERESILFLLPAVFLIFVFYEIKKSVLR